MSRVTDQSYLQSEQYKTPANLAARAELHRRFSTNPTGWLPWVFDQLALAGRTDGDMLMHAAIANAIR